MVYEPATEDLMDLKVLLGLSTTEEDALLQMLMKSVGTKALNDMNQATMPPDFQPVMIEMTSDLYRLKQAEKGEQAQTASSLSDNGQSVTYKDSAYDVSLKDVAKVLKDYETQLTRFRRLGW